MPGPTSISYGSIQDVHSFTFTWGRGISPSIATLTIPVGKVSSIPSVANLVVAYDADFLGFHDCATVDVTPQTGNANMVTVKVADRRWKWEFGSISGRYNRPQINRGATVYINEEPPSRLAILLLTAMGETGFDVSALPNDDRPYVDWENDNPAEELDSLCRSLGCTVVLTQNNTVKIVRTGEGATLPITNKEMNIGYSWSNRPIPKTIRVVTAPIRWSIVKACHPVGQDIDGEIKPIEQLSFEPVIGWARTRPPEFAAVIDVGVVIGGNEVDSAIDNTGTRALTRKAVWKWYRIGNIVAGGDIELEPEFYRDFFNDFPVLSDRVQLFDSSTAVAGGRHLPALLDVSARGDMGFQRTAHWEDGWSLDVNRQLVIFDDHVFTTNAAGDLVSANVRLSCQCEVRARDTDELQRHTIDREVMGGADTEPLIIEAEDLVPVVTDAPGIGKTNFTEIEAEANRRIDAFLASLSRDNSGTTIYSGIFMVELDGAISQVTWSYGAGRAATTVISRNGRHKTPLLSEEHKRRIKATARQEKKQRAANKRNAVNQANGIEARRQQ